MNRLSTAKRAKIFSLLVEGVSLRFISRVEDVSIVTVGRLLSLAGAACSLYHYDYVRGIPGKRTVQCGELWSFIYAKQKKAFSASPWDMVGNAWTFTALDRDSKLLIFYLVAPDRSARPATELFRDLSGRLEESPILVTDELKSDRKAANQVFGKKAGRTLSQMRKGEDSDHNTSYVERHNLIIRMGNRRYTRKTNAFSKKFSKYIDMIHLWALHYNFCRIHTSLHVTPAMEVGLSGTLLDCDWIVWLINSMTLPPKKPGPAKGTKYRSRKI